MTINLKRRGLMLILSSPSGAGKTTLSHKMLEREKDGGMVMSVSVTTRKPRPGEVDGRDYFFVNHEQYLNMAANNEFLEHAQVFENHYGTPVKFVSDHIKNGTDVLFDIDWQGTKQLKAKAPDDVVSIFILPPSMDELHRRLKSRAQDSDEVVAKRMAKASSEISHWGEYDYVLINEDLDKTLDNIIAIHDAERLKRERQTGLAGFIQAL